MFQRCNTSFQLIRREIYNSIPSLFISCSSFSNKEDPLYVPFVTDAESEIASVRFWVSKFTKLKEINIDLRRVYLPFWSFSFDCYVYNSKNCLISSYSDDLPLKRKKCQVYAGRSYSVPLLEEIKVSTKQAVPLYSRLVRDVKEIETWWMHEQTAWNYIRIIVEEQERRNSLQHSFLSNNSLQDVRFEYQNRKSQLVMLPVIIAQNRNQQYPFTVFISGVTGIPLGIGSPSLSLLDSIPFYRLDQYTRSILELCLNQVKKQRMQYISRVNQMKLLEYQELLLKHKDIHHLEDFFVHQLSNKIIWDEVKHLYSMLFNKQSYTIEYENYISRRKKKSHMSACEMNKSIVNLYHVMGVDRDADIEEIKRSFRKLIMQVHPDYCNEMKAEEKTKLLLHAYHVLQNPDTRYHYDLSLLSLYYVY